VPYNWQLLILVFVFGMARGPVTKSSQQYLVPAAKHDHIVPAEGYADLLSAIDGVAAAESAGRQRRMLLTGASYLNQSHSYR